MPKKKMKTPSKLPQSALDQERLAEVGRLSRNIGHELTNIFQILTTTLELSQDRLKLKDPKSTQMVMNDIKEMMSVVTLGSEMCQNLMILAKEPPSSQKFFKLQKISLSQAIHKTLHLLKPEIEKQKVDIIVCVPTDLKVYFYEPHLLQVLINLIKNALAALPKKGRIRIETLEQENLTQLRIQDNGSGISLKNQKNLFQPYFTTKGTKGTGLGLATCLSLLQNYQSTISLTSNEGEGTTVEIAFLK